MVSETLSAQLWVQEQKVPVNMREAEGAGEHPASHPASATAWQCLLDQSRRSQNGSGQGQLDLGSSSYLLPWCGQLRSDRTSQEMSWTRVARVVSASKIREKQRQALPDSCLRSSRVPRAPVCAQRIPRPGWGWGLFCDP